jgi:hypothetical protein
LTKADLQAQGATGRSIGRPSITRYRPDATCFDAPSCRCAAGPLRNPVPPQLAEKAHVPGLASVALLVRRAAIQSRVYLAPAGAQLPIEWAGTCPRPARGQLPCPVRWGRQRRLWGGPDRRLVPNRENMRDSTFFAWHNPGLGIMPQGMQRCALSDLGSLSSQMKDAIELPLRQRIDGRPAWKQPTLRSRRLPATAAAYRLELAATSHSDPCGPCPARRGSPSGRCRYRRP